MAPNNASRVIALDDDSGDEDDSNTSVSRSRPDGSFHGPSSGNRNLSKHPDPAHQNKIAVHGRFAKSTSRPNRDEIGTVATNHNVNGLQVEDPTEPGDLQNVAVPSSTDRLSPSSQLIFTSQSCDCDDRQCQMAQPDIIKTEDEQSEVSVGTARKPTDDPRYLEQQIHTIKPVMASDEALPSSSNSVVTLKRAHNEEQDTPTNTTESKRRKLNDQLYGSSLSSNPKPQPTNFGNEKKGITTSKTALGRESSSKETSTIIDLTNDDSDDEDGRILTRGIRQTDKDSFRRYVNAGMYNAERASEGPGTLHILAIRNEDKSRSSGSSIASQNVGRTSLVDKAMSSPPEVRTTLSKHISQSFSNLSNTRLGRTGEVSEERRTERPSRTPRSLGRSFGELPMGDKLAESLAVSDLSPSSASKSRIDLAMGSRQAGATFPAGSPAKSSRKGTKQTVEQTECPMPLSPSETSTEDISVNNTKGQLHVDKPGQRETRNRRLSRAELGSMQNGADLSLKKQQQQQRGSAARPNIGGTVQIADELTGSAGAFRGDRDVSGGSDIQSSTVLLRQTAKTTSAHEPAANMAAFNRSRIERSRSRTRSPTKPSRYRHVMAQADKAECGNAIMTPDSTSFEQPALPMFSNLSTAKQIEQAVGRYIEELQSDNEHWIQTWLKRARASIRRRKTIVLEEPPTDVFSKMAPLILDDRSKKVGPDHAKFVAESYPTAHKSQKKIYTVPCTSYKTSEADVPNYSHYVSISRNFLAHNETSLQHWPYFGDEFDLNEAEGLDQQYFLDVADRWDKLRRLGLAENLAPYAEDMLKDAGCHWSDVLRFLLDPDPNVGTDKDAQRALEIRDSLCKEDFSRSQEPWTTVLAKLPKPHSENVGRAAILCECFQSLTKLSLWQLARRDEYTAKLLQEGSRDLNMDELTCRVCMRFNCPHHGEIKENSEDDDDDGIAGSHVVETDIVHPPNVNHRSRVGFPPAIDTQEPPTAVRDRRALRYWQNAPNASLLFKADDRGPFYPCHHPGTSCNSAQCSCFENKIPCEKTCSCPQSCARKFQGCNCSMVPKRKGRKRVCFEEETCACFQLGRECDPDLCGDCGVCEVLDPVNRNDDRILPHRCSNASIQREIPKHTIVGDSAVHGLGLYACEAIKEHDFVGEYTGEIITKDEAERRGAVYEHQKLSYLFTLNKQQEIDSTYFGNKIRFINHANKSKCNLYPRIIMVNSVHRIALYGQRNIRPGEELFFDYGPMFPGDQLVGKTGRKTDQQSGSKAAPHVRNAGLVKGFHDVDHDEDEFGNRRARKATGSGFGRSRSSRTPERKSKQWRPPHENPQWGADSMSVDEDDASDTDINEDALYEHLSGLRAVADKIGVGSAEDYDHSSDDEEFEPDDSQSVPSEEADPGSEECELDSESEEDDEPIPTSRKRAVKAPIASLHTQSELYRRGR